MPVSRSSARLCSSRCSLIPFDMFAVVCLCGTFVLVAVVVDDDVVAYSVFPFAVDVVVVHVDIFVAAAVMFGPTLLP